MHTYDGCTVTATQIYADVSIAKSTKSDADFIFIKFSQHPSLTVAILEFTQQLYSVQENLGPLAVSLRLASNSPTLASNLGANPVQVRISSDGTGSATGGGSYLVRKRTEAYIAQTHNTRCSSLSFTASPNAGADYNPVSTLVSFNAGDGPLTLSQPQVSITIINDNTVEQTETFGLTGTITSGVALARFVDNTATAQIIDDDGKVKNTCVQHTVR